jgi:tetratricopeptide (TPR) repeat protein
VAKWILVINDCAARRIDSIVSTLQVSLNTGVIEVFLRKVIFATIVLSTVSSLSYCSNVTPVEAAQWREDLHFFADQAPQVHKNLYHTITREQFDAAVKNLDERIPTLSRNQIVTVIMRIVAMIGDGHTHLEINQLQSGFRHYAVKFYWFPDGIYVVQADKKYAPVVGGKILKLGKVSGQEAYEAVRQVVPHDNESQIKGSTPLYLSLAEVLDGLGLVDDPDAVPLTVEKNGVEATAILKPEESEISKLQFVLPPGWVDARDPASPVPLWLKDPGNFYWFQYLPYSHTIYVQFNRVAEKPDETINAFFKRVLAYADARPVDRFVLDERLNDGGNNELLRPIIHGFIRSDKVNQPGKLFTMIGRHTFSAAMNCVNRMKLNTDTLFVGEPTASSPNHFGDNAPVVLPNSKLTVRLSTLWWQDMDPRDTRVWQAPDLTSQLTFADYYSGRDPAMDLILHYKPGPSIAEIVRTAAERNGYAGAKDALLKFQKDPLHKYASVEQDLERLGYDLVGEKKLDQAILVFKLNVEAYSNSFNTWNSLGEAYMIRGDKNLAIKDFNKSLELNPKNADARTQLAKLRAQ